MGEIDERPECLSVFHQQKTTHQNSIVSYQNDRYKGGTTKSRPKMRRNISVKRNVVMTSLMLQTIVFVSRIRVSYAQEQCPDGNGVGYSDLASLQDALDSAYSDSGGQQGGQYRLCPNTVFSFGPSTPSSATARMGMNGINDNDSFEHVKSQVVTSFGYETWEAKIRGTHDLNRKLGRVNKNWEEKNIYSKTESRNLQDYPSPQDDFSSLLQTMLQDDMEDDEETKTEIFMLQSQSAADLLSMLGAEDLEDPSDLERLINFADTNEDYYYYGDYSQGRTFRQSNSQIDPIVILSSQTILSCGDEGHSENSCVFQGGGNQIVIGEDAQQVVLAGITFEGANDVNVVSSGSENSSVTLADCLWRVSVEKVNFIFNDNYAVENTNIYFSLFNPEQCRFFFCDDCVLRTNNTGPDTPTN